MPYPLHDCYQPPNHKNYFNTNLPLDSEKEMFSLYKNHCSDNNNAERMSGMYDCLDN